MIFALLTHLLYPHANLQRLVNCLHRLFACTTDITSKGIIDDVTYFEKTDSIKKQIEDLRVRRNKLLSEELILSGLSYAVTGDDNILDAYVIEQKIKDLKQDMEDMITMSMRTEGDTEKFEVEIRKISDQLCAMRSQLEVARTQTQASEKVNQEIESIKMFLADTEINFSEYNEIVVRKLIECIRVMPDGTLVIVLKGGMTIEEQIAA